MSARLRRTAVRAQRGFTLIEVLVASSLLALILVALGGALFNMGQAGQRIDARMALTDEFRVATGFVRQALGRVSSRDVNAVTQGGAARQPLFLGAPDGVAWVGVMPAGYGAGGRNFFRLAIEPGANGNPALVLRFMPWTDQPAFPNWGAATARELVADAQGLALRYQDAGAVPQAWQGEWRGRERLPTLVGLRVTTGTGEWPELMVPVRELVRADTKRGGFSVGGRQ